MCSELKGEEMKRGGEKTRRCNSVNNKRMRVKMMMIKFFRKSLSLPLPLSCKSYGVFLLLTSGFACLLSSLFSLGSNGMACEKRSQKNWKTRSWLAVRRMLQSFLSSSPRFSCTLGVLFDFILVWCLPSGICLFFWWSPSFPRVGFSKERFKWSHDDDDDDDD